MTENRNERSDAYLQPAVDVIEDSEGITLYADLPGVSREGLALHVEGDTLNIEGLIRLEVSEGLELSHVELNVPRYRRAFTLSRELDAERIQAELAHGVLRLRIPRVAREQPRRVEVKVL